MRSFVVFHFLRCGAVSMSLKLSEGRGSVFGRNDCLDGDAVIVEKEKEEEDGFGENNV